MSEQHHEPRGAQVDERELSGEVLGAVSGGNDEAATLPPTPDG